MSARLIAAAAAAMPDIDKGQIDPLVPQSMLVREAVGLLGWGTMTYRCDACGFKWEVWLSLGVEGPPSLRDNGLYVASPFTLSSCPAWPNMTRCSGSMAHVNFRGDREFPPTLIPDDVPRFVLDNWHDCADLVIPTPALIYARRFHNEPDA
jgi:hypothetical protein